MGDEGAKPGRRGGGNGSIPPHNGRAHGHTHAHGSIIARAAHLTRATMAAVREAVGGGDGGRDDARKVGRRAEAAGTLRRAHRGACEHGLSRVRRVTSEGRRSSLRVRSRRQRTFCVCSEAARGGSSSGGAVAPIYANHPPQPAQCAEPRQVQPLEP